MARKIYCPHCKFVGSEEVVRPGDKKKEQVLFFLFILPGLVYRYRRNQKRSFRCPKCKNRLTLRYHPQLETKGELQW